jgi:hypothetical protein
MHNSHNNQHQHQHHQNQNQPRSNSDPQAKITLTFSDHNRLRMTNEDYPSTQFLIGSFTLIGPVSEVYSAAIGLGFSENEIFDKLDSVDENAEYAMSDQGWVQLHSEDNPDIGAMLEEDFGPFNSEEDEVPF